MGSNVLVVPGLQKRAWISSMQKQMILGSVFENLSSRAVATDSQANEKSSVPDSVVQYVSDKFSPGVMYVTIPSMDKLKKKGPGGFQPADGTEETPTLRYGRVYYNVKRKAVTFADGTVEGDATEAMEILSEKTRLMGDYFAELNDYDKQRSLCLGADEFLTESEYWTGSSTAFQTAPVPAILHPNTVIIGQTGIANPATYNATLETNLGTSAGGLAYACNQAGVAARKFSKARLDAIVRYANAKILPLNWKSGGMTVTHVLKISQETANQLMADTTTSGAGNWWATFTAAGARGVENRAISGILGIYQGMLIIVDVRAPLFNCSTSVSGAARFQFVKPWSDSGSTAIDAGDNRVPTVKTDTTGASSGTMECNFILGRGAIGVAEVRKLAFHEEDKDYAFRKGFEARMSNGNMRMDQTNQNQLPGAWSSLSAYPDNWTSAMFLVPTTAQTL